MKTSTDKVFSRNLLQPLLLYVMLCLFVVTVEMRPGRVYMLLQMLLFRESVQQLVIYLLLFAYTVWGIHIALLNKSKWVCLAYLVFLFPFLSISLSYRLITGYNYSYADAQTALNNLHLFKEAWATFTLSVVLAIAAAFLICLLFWFINRRAKGIYSKFHFFLVLPAMLLSHWYIHETNGNTDDLPVAYRVPLSTLAAYQRFLPLQDRLPVTVLPRHAGVKHLFLIVDESITGSYLSLNGYAVATTPFLNSNKDSIQNFGIAAAFTNQSAGSNIALMSGLQMAELPDKEFRALTRPSIFQYAKKAGYTTYFIDAQVGKGALQNYMSLQDLKHIDHFVQIGEQQPDLPYYMRDFAGAELLLTIVDREQKSFVYFNKAGAHWPYARTYPPDSVFYKPVLPEQSMMQDKEKSLNTYYNAIRWTVDGFWKQLLPALIPLDSTYIMYTSDHGQDLSGDGISIRHARTTQTAAVEADVPLWVLDKTGYSLTYSSPQPNQQTHAQIFPTLLLMQGYDSKFIRNNYGLTLYDAVEPTPRTFLSGDIFGRGPHQTILFDALRP